MTPDAIAVVVVALVALVVGVPLVTGAIELGARRERGKYQRERERAER